MDSSG